MNPSATAVMFALLIAISTTTDAATISIRLEGSIVEGSLNDVHLNDEPFALTATLVDGKDIERGGQVGRFMIDEAEMVIGDVGDFEFPSGSIQFLQAYNPGGFAVGILDEQFRNQFLYEDNSEAGIDALAKRNFDPNTLSSFFYSDFNQQVVVGPFTFSNVDGSRLRVLELGFPASVSVAIVPEPNTTVIALIASAGLMCFRRKSRTGALKCLDANSRLVRP